MSRWAWGAAICSLWGASPALAHPHVFVSSGVEVIFNAAGQATALRISWTYDELFSLMIFEDRGLDADADGKLTPEEQAQLSGFDMAWDEGFAGDTFALLGETPLELGRPQDWTAEVVGEDETAMIRSTHLRAFASPVAVQGADLVIQSYDPDYYTAYTIDAAPVLTGRSDCAAQIFEPDAGLADQIAQAALQEYTAEDIAEGKFPAVGAAYADEVRVTCAAPS